MDNDSALIAGILSGEIESFGTLVRRHQARVRLLSLIRLGNRDEADDAAQDIFVKAFKKLSQFKGESTFETWLLKIADHHCLDRLRSRTRHRTESLEALFEAQGDRIEELISRTNSGAAASPHTPDDLELLARFFAAMPEEDRELFVLREVEELSYEEMARSLGCTLDAVKGRLKRARKELMRKCGSLIR